MMLLSNLPDAIGLVGDAMVLAAYASVVRLTGLDGLVEFNAMIEKPDDAKALQ